MERTLSEINKNKAAHLPIFGDVRQALQDLVQMLDEQEASGVALAPRENGENALGDQQEQGGPSADLRRRAASLAGSGADVGRTRSERGRVSAPREWRERTRRSTRTRRPICRSSATCGKPCRIWCRCWTNKKRAGSR